MPEIPRPTLAARRRIRLLAVSAAALAMTLGGLTAASPASAGVYGSAPYGTIAYAGSSWCLESNWDGQVFLDDCISGDNYQNWYTVDWTNDVGDHMIENAQTALCLQGPLSDHYDDAPRTVTCDSSDPRQQWYINGTEFRTELYDAPAEGCLDHSAFGPVILPCNDVSSLDWSLFW